MAPTLASLLQTMTFDQALQLVLAYYQKQGFPTSSWQDFGADLTRAQAIATVIVDVVTNQIPSIAGGTLLDYAPNFPGWTELTAQQFFNLAANGAVQATGNMLATNASGSAYSYTDTNPILFAFSDSGDRWKSTGSGTIPAHGTLTIPVIAELPGAKYNADPSNSGSINVVTPSMPGVTVTNPSTAYTAPIHTGSGTGTLTLGGAPALAHTVVIIVTATAAGIPATVSYSLDGAAAIPLGTVSSVTNLGGTGINITFVNGASGFSWVNGDTYQFSTPASWITSQGADLESDVSLAGDCRNQWSTLAGPPTGSLYAYLAKRTPGVGAQVTQCFVITDSVINNKINVVVAGPGGVLPAPTITLIQNYLTPRARGCDNPVVQSPTTAPVVIAATITALASQLALVQATVNTELLNYIASLPVNGTIELGEIIALIRDTTSVTRVNVASVLINGVAADLTLGSPTTFTLPAYPPTLNLSMVGQ